MANLILLNFVEKCYSPVDIHFSNWQPYNVSRNMQEGTQAAKKIKFDIDKHKKSAL